MTTINDPRHDEDEFRFDFGEAAVLVIRATWKLTDREGGTPAPEWPTLRDDLVDLANALRTCDTAPVVSPSRPGRAPHKPSKRRPVKVRKG